MKKWKLKFMSFEKMVYFKNSEEALDYMLDFATELMELSKICKLFIGGNDDHLVLLNTEQIHIANLDLILN